MSGIDVWGAVVPAWLGGVGGMAAAVVSSIALVKSLKTQGGVETLKAAANAGVLLRLQRPHKAQPPPKPECRHRSLRRAG